MDRFDHDEDAEQDTYERHRDKVFADKLARCESASKSGEVVANPWDEIKDSQSDPLTLLFSEEITMDEKVQRILGFMASLTEAQRDMVREAGDKWLNSLPESRRAQVLGRDGLKAWNAGEDWHDCLRGWQGLGEQENRIFVERGALLDLMSVQEYFKLEERAKRTYEEIIDLGKNEFASRINRHTGISLNRLKRVFDHIFITEHELQCGFRTFPPDPDMADSFTRLLSGKGVREYDIVLLKHEHLELAIMKKIGYNYIKAHRLSETKYNYRSALEKWNDSNGKNYST